MIRRDARCPQFFSAGCFSRYYVAAYSCRMSDNSPASPSPGSPPDFERLLPEFRTLCEVIARLRSPQGCPWDRQQTLETIKRIGPLARQLRAVVWSRDGTTLYTGLDDGTILEGDDDSWFTDDPDELPSE